LFLVIANFKDLDETGELQNLPCRRAETEQNELGTEVAGRFQAFDKGGDTRTVDVTDLAEIDHYA